MGACCSPHHDGQIRGWDMVTGNKALLSHALGMTDSTSANVCSSDFVRFAVLADSKYLKLLLVSDARYTRRRTPPSSV
jgi:hypothetical protein